MLIRVLMLLVASALVANAANADDVTSRMSVKQRLERLERLMSPDVLIERSQQIDALREEIAILREQLELQNYEFETIKQRQRSLYLDMDRRIQNLESGSGGSRGSRGSRGAAPVPPPGAGTVVTGGSASHAADDKDGKVQYTEAFGLLKEGRYQQSISGFEKFLKAHPDSKYADNAQYWLGEANYVSRHYKKSLNEFQRLISKYPDSPKVSGARLKIGYIYFELKNWSASREALQKVVKLYPDDTVAKKAKERIQRIEREGR